MAEPQAGNVVQTQTRGRIRIVTMNRPERLNAFNVDMIVGLLDALEEAAKDDGVHVVILTGAGRAFSSGADLSDMGKQPAFRKRAPGETDSFDRLQAIAEAFPKPLIAAANGIGVGFGFTILGYCDFCFVAESARFRAPFSQLGLSPEGSSSYLFPLRMGWATAARALLSGDWFSAQAIVDAGLAQEIVPDGDLMDVVIDFAERLAECPLQSLVATKALMLEAHLPAIRRTRESERNSLQQLLGTPANKAAVNAFAQRGRQSRKPLESED